MPCNPITKQVKNYSTLLQCQSKECMSHTTPPNTIFTLYQMPEKRLDLEPAHRPSSGTSHAHFQRPSFIQHSLQCFNLHPLSEAPLRPPLRAPLEHFMSGWVGNDLASLIFPWCRCECMTWLQLHRCLTSKWMLGMNWIFFDYFVPIYILFYYTVKGSVLSLFKYIFRFNSLKLNSNERLIYCTFYWSWWWTKYLDEVFSANA